MKKCPFCAELIQDAATVCKHCHTRDLVPKTNWLTRDLAPQTHWFTWLVLIVILAIVGMVTVGSCTACLLTS